MLQGSVRAHACCGIGTRVRVSARVCACVPWMVDEHRMCLQQRAYYYNTKTGVSTWKPPRMPDSGLAPLPPLPSILRNVACALRVLCLRVRCQAGSAMWRRIARRQSYNRTCCYIRCTDLPACKETVRRREDDCLTHGCSTAGPDATPRSDFFSAVGGCCTSRDEKMPRGNYSHESATFIPVRVCADDVCAHVRLACTHIACTSAEITEQVL